MSIKEYIDLRFSEYKLKGIKAVSRVISLLLSMFLVVVVLAIVFNLIAYLLVRWLDGIFGFPWGVLIVIGFFLAVLLILWLCRKKLFKRIFIRSIIDDPSINTEKDIDAELRRVKSGIRQCDETKKAMGLGFKVAGIIFNSLRSCAAGKKG